jgi:hypothetical protein
MPVLHGQVTVPSGCGGDGHRIEVARTGFAVPVHQLGADAGPFMGKEPPLGRVSFGARPGQRGHRRRDGKKWLASV